MSKKPLQTAEEEIQNLIHGAEEAVGSVIHKKKKRLHQKPHFWLFVVFFAVIIILAILYVSFWQPIQNSLTLTQQTQAQFEKVQTDLLSADFVAAKQDIETAQKLLTKLEANVDKLDSPLMLGYLRSQYNGIQNMIYAIQEFSDGLYILTDLSQDVLSQVKRDAITGNLSLEPDKRQEILTKFSQKTPELNGAKAQLDLALINLNQISISKLNPTLAEYVLTLRAKMGLLRDFLDKAVGLSESLPSLMGLNQEKTYLFLLQNNDELRPTGGFLGTIGILKIKNGQITSFDTHNVYDYDKFAHDKLFITPPAPIDKYLNVKGWYMRDSNWSADFPEAVKQIEWFYHKEAQLSNDNLRDYQIDGVIAITPKIVEEFLGITGAIEVESFVFSKNNFVERLQYLVEVGYEDQGVEYFQRKNIIGQLGKDLIKRTENLNLHGWLELVKSVFNNLNQKHILIATKDAYVQNLVEQHNWAGAVNQTQDDYLLVVDANLAALKSNQCVKRDVIYRILPNMNEEKIAARVDIHYTNNCTFTWKSTRYRTYTRIYTPLGSEWIKTQGSMETDRTSTLGITDVSQENNKTVMGTFIAVEPGHSGTLSFEYFLPDYLSAQMFEGQEYNLYLQKQPGTLKDGMSVDLVFPYKVKIADPSEPKNNWGDKRYKLQTDLEVDRQVRVGF